MSDSDAILQLNQAKKRIIVFTVLAILLTGVFVGLSTSVPLYLAAKSYIEQVYLTSAQSHVLALDNQFARYQSLAEQFTSRTEIRKRLSDYAHQRLSLAEVQAYSQPRLADPVNHIDDLAAMVRIDAVGTVIARVGPEANQLHEQGTQLILDEPGLTVLCLDDIPGKILIRVTAPIIDADKQTIGTDILYFYPDALQPLLQAFGAFSQARLLLVNQASRYALGFNQQIQQVSEVDLSHTDPVLLSTPEVATLARVEQATQPMILLRLPMQVAGWSLHIYIPQALFYRSAQRDLVWSLVTIGVLLLLGLALSHLLARPLIKRLIAQAIQIEHGAVELRLAASVFEKSQEAMIITDQRLMIMRINPGFSQTFHIQIEPLLGKYLTDFMTADPMADMQEISSDPERLAAHIQSMANFQGEVWYRYQGRLIPTWQSTTAVYNDAGEVVYFIHVLKDIHQQKAVEQQMKQLALHDSLTDLPNRYALMGYLQKRIAQCEQPSDRFVVMFIDLDQFKPVNDTYGHHMGDQLLLAVAQRIRSLIRNEDIVGRLGGDEFLLIAQTHEAEAQLIADKLIAQLAQPFEIDGVTLLIGASIGIASYPQHGRDADTLVHAADQAMYQAKENGRNQYALAS